MFEKNSKFPRFFILMLIPVAAVMLFGMFFSMKFVAYSYFVALLIALVFLMMDRHYGENLTNYKLAFFVFDFINLIAVIVVIYYEFAKHSLLLNIMLFVLIFVLVVLHVVDGIALKNKHISKRYSLIVGLINVATMICILTYFYNVSDLFFVIDALVFEIASVIIKLVLVFSNKIQKQENGEEFDLVSIIRSEDDEGDLD